MRDRPVVLAIGGHDPTSGAGITLDSAAIRHAGAHPLTVPTALTIQDTSGVRGFLPMEPAIFREQLAYVTSDIQPDAVKIGMLPTLPLVHEVRRFLEVVPAPVVLDPILAASDGSGLVDPEELSFEHFVPILDRTSLLTPNLQEAEALLGRAIHVPDDLDAAGWDILDFGCEAVLLKGGHRSDVPEDVLFTFDSQVPFPGKWIEGPEVHGTGCLLSSLIAAGLARRISLVDAIREAKGMLYDLLVEAQVIGAGRALVQFPVPRNPRKAR